MLPAFACTIAYHVVNKCCLSCTYVNSVLVLFVFEGSKYKHLGIQKEVYEAESIVFSPRSNECGFQMEREGIFLLLNNKDEFFKLILNNICMFQVNMKVLNLYVFFSSAVSINIM